MGDIAIRVSDLSKCYHIYDNPKDRLKQTFFGASKQYYKEFWALRDVSFEVQRGEALGIIGRNGSGKSTLLQLIAGTLHPTGGEIEVNGRVAALLELGSGFNPDFTGRENVYLNGSVLGLGREEIDARFDEIAAFADIGEFIEQPVKTYSSGMFVRLAFAVQACIDPDIFIVDEALAVGDIFFRQKCYQRFDQLRNKGCAVLLVSHGMGDIEQFCQKALLLEHGNSVFLGNASEAVKRYYLLDQQQRVPESVLSNRLENEGTPGLEAPVRMEQRESFAWPDAESLLDISNVSQVTNGWARCTGVALCNEQLQPCYSFEQGEKAIFFYEFEILHDLEVPIGGVVIQNDKGIIVHGKSTYEYGSDVPELLRNGERLRFRQEISLELALGEYTFEIGLAVMSKIDYVGRCNLTHADFFLKRIRVCHLPNAGVFQVRFRAKWFPVQLLHHGIANLQGGCVAKVI
ncbi:MAG: ABC transporter ATP-binding protein [Gammaproteobacteria bacterium]|nr:ABC transporter ATP-binding protein [Gammaproteobacteria bacterium]